MKKLNKKMIPAIVASGLLVAALAGGATVAFLTDTEQATNTFTVGSVDISLLESQLHRVNAGTTVAGRLSTDEIPMEGQAGEAPEDAYGWAGAFFTDDQIKEDAATYQSEYLAEEGEGILPGDNVMKCPYVVNEGKSDAFVRVRVLIPAVLDNGILANSMYTSSILQNAATLKVTNDKNVDGKLYNEYAFTYNDALEPGQMTFWNCWGDIKIGENVTSEQLQALIDSGDIDPQDGSFGVLVEADAIQAAGFENAAAAFTAFDAQ